MKSSTSSSSPWATSSFGGSPDTSPMELSALGDHLNHCKGKHERWFALRCVAESMNGFVSARFVTTLMVVILLIGAASLIL